MFRETEELTTQDPQITNEPAGEGFEAILASDLEMYQIPGHEKITRRTLERYMEDKRQDASIDIAAANQQQVFDFGKQVRSAPRDERARLIRVGLASDDVEIRKVAARLIWQVSDDEKDEIEPEIVRLITAAFNTNNTYLQKETAEMIWAISEDRKTGLIKMMLGSNNNQAQRTATDAIRFAQPQVKVDLIQLAFASSDPKVCEIAFTLIEHVSAAEKAALYDSANTIAESALSSGDHRRQRAVAKMLSSSSDVSLIRKALNSSEISVNVAAAELITTIFVGLRQELIDKITEGLNSDNPRSQRAAVRMIKCIPKTERRQSFDLAKTKAGEALVASPLYDSSDFSGDGFAKNDLIKTGADLTLIDGPLKDKVVDRHMGPRAFRTWQRLYEDHQLWRSERFDYVPIEPIVSYRLDRNGLVDTYSGVLDLSLRDWGAMTNEFVPELYYDCERINSALKKSGAQHGHTHTGNFCLRFYRDQEGKIDFGRKPRVYMIDFDVAKDTKALDWS